MDTVDRIAEVWGGRTPHGRDEPWPVRVDQHLAEGITEADVDRRVPSASVLCSNGCGCDVAVSGGRMVGVRGRASDVVNHGRLGPKGLYGSWQWQRRDRLTRPLVREDDRLVETDWDTAMGRIVERSRSLLEETGPLSHGFYTSGQLFSEEYYTDSRAATATSSTATRSSCSGTTWPRRRRCCGCGCSTGCTAPTRRGSSPWIRAARRSPRPRSRPAVCTSRRCPAPTRR
jgi:anaerobic selenocysteine-containing dehydrogenase